MDLMTLAIGAAFAWIAGVALSWTLAVLRSRRADIVVAVAALLAYRFTRGDIRLPMIFTALVVLATRARFDEFNRVYGDAARSLGASEWRLAVRGLPLNRRSILLALAICVLGFYVSGTA